LKNNLVLKYGLSAALGASIIMFIGAYRSLNNGVTFVDYSFFVLIAAQTLLVIELRKDDGEILFSMIFKRVFMVGLIMALLSGIAYYFIITYYDRNILMMMKDLETKVMDQMEYPKEYIDMHDKIITTNAPAYYAFQNTFGAFVWATISSISMATFLKRKKIEISDEQQY
jgi:hypothetical protein